MEIMKSNLPQSLNMSSSKRATYIKPPIPPKPKIIPKPKNFAHLNDWNSKSIKLLHANDKFSGTNVTSIRPDCDRLSSASDESNFTTERQETVSGSVIRKNSSDFNNCSNNIPQCDESCQNNLEVVTCIKISENNNNINLNSPDDVSSRLMENTMENYAEISSKSSSNLSINLDDSDSDEFLPNINTNFSSPTSLTYSSNLAVVTLYDTSSSSNTSLTFINNNNDDDEVKNNECNRKNKSFLVAKEIATSEESFVATLKLLNEEFMAFLVNKGCINAMKGECNEKNFRTDAIPKKILNEIFKYLPNLQSLNEKILADFEVRIKEWDSNTKIADIIIKKGPFLKLYTNYIRELKDHTILLQDCADRYPFFGECLKEFENSEMSRFIPVSKHMLTPMQRITKYKELVKQYLKYLHEDSIDYADAVHALEIVKDVAKHANEAIRELENSARLLCLQERLNGISNADGTSMGSSTGHLQHLLVEPGRRLLKEGQLMKLCRRDVRVVYLILLSDYLLYTTQELHGGKNCPLKLRYKLPLEGMRVKIPVSEDFQTEFTVISTSRSFTVRASCGKERDEWLSSLRSAIESNATRRLSFVQAKTAKFEALALNALGKQAPAWVPDNRVTMCQICVSEFSLTFRRHHCRACGKVVCRYCSANRAPLAYMDHHIERVCDKCFEELQKVLEVMEEKEGEIVDELERERFRASVRTMKGKFKGSNKDGRCRRMKKPERLLEVCGGDHASQICGYLRYYSRRSWRQSWFVLKDKVLYEYRAPEDACALNSLPILGYRVNTEFESLDIFDGMDHSNAFQLLHENQSPFIFYAESNELADKWRTVMEKEVNL